MFCRALYIQELLLGTVDENSQNVITATTPVAARALSLSITSEECPEAIALAHDVMMLEIDADEQHGAQALQLQPVHHHHHSGSGTDAATAMKKSFIRKKEMTAVDEGGKKQKSKVSSNTRK